MVATLFLRLVLMLQKMLRLRRSIFAFVHEPVQQESIGFQNV